MGNAYLCSVLSLLTGGEANNKNKSDNKIIIKQKYQSQILNAMEEKNGPRTLSEEELKNISGGVGSEISPELKCSLICSGRSYKYVDGNCICDEVPGDDWLQNPQTPVTPVKK